MKLFPRPLLRLSRAICALLLACVGLLFFSGCDLSLSRQPPAPPLELEFLEDEQGVWTVNAVSVPPLSDRFEAIPHISPVFGYTDSAYWIRFSIERDGVTPLLLELQFPLIANVDLYSPWPGGGFLRVRSGSSVPYQSRELPARTLVFRLPQSKAETVTYFLRLQGGGSIQVPLRLWRVEDFAAHRSIEDLLFGIYFGVILAMAICALVLLLISWEPNILFYALFITTVGLYQLTELGYASQFFWPDATPLVSFMPTLLAGLNLIALLLFADRLLQFEKHAPFVHLATKLYLVLIAALLFLIPVLELDAGIRLVRGIALIAVLVLIAPVLMRWRSGYLPAFYCLLGFAALLIGTGVDAMLLQGWLPYHAVTVWSFEIGTAVAIVMLSMAFANRLNLLKIEKQAAQTEAYRYLTDQNERLEMRVHERTDELERAKERLERMNKDLQKTNRMLSRIAMYDGLTGLLNLRSFMDQLDSKLREAGRYHYPVALIMIDLDHFKQINDTYGHQVGDAALKSAARLLSSSSRESDVVGRYGGEEMMLMLPGLDGENPARTAVALAERLHREMMEIRLDEAPELRITGSFGVSWTLPGDVIEPGVLISRADKALYRAKENGRNQVCVEPPSSPQLESEVGELL
jgi:diguanylate cyclase (GGDEF)-like protein